MKVAYKYLLKRSEKCSYDNSTQCCINATFSITLCLTFPITINFVSNYHRTMCMHVYGSVYIIIPSNHSAT